MKASVSRRSDTRWHSGNGECCRAIYANLTVLGTITESGSQDDSYQLNTAGGLDAGGSMHGGGSDVGYGNMTITGTGSGSGWASGYSNYSNEGTTFESNWTSSSGYSYSGWSSGWDNSTGTNGYGYQEGWNETYSYGWGSGLQWGSGGTASGSNTDNSGNSWGWTQYSGGAWTSGSGGDSTSSSGSYSESISSPGFYGGGLSWSPFATAGQGLGYGMSAPDPGTSMTSGEAPGDVPADGATGPTGSSGDAGGDGEEDVDRGQSPEEWADNNSDPDHPGEHSWFFKIAEWGDGQYKAFYDVPDRETLQDHAATDEQGDAELAMRTQLASIFMQMPILCDGAVVEKDGTAIGVLRYGKLYEFKSVTAQQDKFPNADYIEAVAGQWGQVADALAPFAAGAQIAADIATDFMPGIREWKAVSALWSGENFVTGKEASVVEQAVGAAIIGVNLAKVVRKASQIDRQVFAAEREAYWKAEAKTNAGKYSPEDLAKMKEGRPPTGADGYPKELHHVDRTPEGGLEPMDRTDHRLGDNYKKNHP